MSQYFSAMADRANRSREKLKQKEQLRNQLDLEINKEKYKRQKQEKRKTYLMGLLLKQYLDQGQELYLKDEADLKSKLDGFLFSDRDRQLFDLPPKLDESQANKETKQEQ